MKGVRTHPLIVAVAMGLLAPEALEALPSGEACDVFGATNEGASNDGESSGGAGAYSAGGRSETGVQPEVEGAEFAAVERAWREARSRV